MGKRKPKLSPLERVIAQRERGIRDLEQRKEDAMERAHEECDRVDKLIAVRRVLLDALKRGALKP